MSHAGSASAPAPATATATATASAKVSRALLGLQELPVDSVAAGRLTEFVKRFRRHFVSEMQPQFMLDEWSVDYPVLRRVHG